MKIILSYDAISYFAINNITPAYLTEYIIARYDLKHNDVVFHEGNLIGYEKRNLETYPWHPFSINKTNP